jgi:outer membrane protein OmpA-like peptidoglycan-associated protein
MTSQMNMKKISILAFVLTCTISAISQVKAGNKNYSRMAYAKAAANYERALKKDSSDVSIWANLADCYRLNRNSAGAEKAYAHVIQSGKAEPVHYLYYVNALMENEKYEEAGKILNEYKSANAGDERGKQLEQGIRNAKSILAKSGSYSIKAVNINSTESDIAPVAFNGGIVFSSNRKFVQWVDNSHSWSGKQFYRLYHANGNAANFGKPTLFASNLQTSYHDGPVTFNGTGSLMIFTRNNIIEGKVGKDEKEVVKLKLFSSAFSDNKWGIEVPLPFNSDNYSCAHPALTADGLTLYFSSDMPGGSGGMDIWKSNWNGTAWSSPVNLGDDINTPGNELFPFFSSDNVLYYSSDGLDGIGGLDIYTSQLSGSSFSKPENVGAPINSSDDDFGITYNPNAKTGYFSSNRKNQGLNDDIYMFEKLCTNTEITIADEETKQPLGNATVRIFENNVEIGSVETDDSGKFIKCLNPARNYEFRATKNSYDDNKSTLTSDQLQQAAATGTSVQLSLKKKPNNIANVSGKVFNEDDKSPVTNQVVTLINKSSGETKTATTDNNGRYQFDNIEIGVEYTIKTSKKDCGEPSETFNTKNITGTKNITMDFPLLCKGDVIKIENIYYDYNKSDIRPDAAKELDKVVDILNKYPTMTIELRSHTDSRGKDAYNEKLSDSRAKSAAQYIISRGIETSRLKAKGYGEKELLNKCINGVECDDKMHEENRRTEFKILSL